MSVVVVDSSARRTRRRTRGRFPPSFIVGCVLMGLMVLVAILGPFLVPHPNALHLEHALQSPSWAHPFGTDEYGRDVLGRMMVATTLDLVIALGCVIPALIIGTIVGTLTGYFGGWFDSILMRIVDVLVAFPFVVLVIAVVAVLGASVTNLFIAVAVVGWVSYARLVRSEVQVVRRHDYVRAARVLGYSRRRILRRHVLPNVIVQPLVYSTNDFVGYILLVSALGYLGLGVQPPNAEWGTMIADGKNYLSQAPWMSVFPGLAIVVVAIACILIGNALGDVLRPEAKS
jgi:peptide/nickel transport system permease protein